MPVALTVFGIAAQGDDPIFCYAFLRDVRGRGAYPKPNLPKNKIPNGTTRVALETFEGLELICWDKMLAEGEATAAQVGIARGHHIIPEDCPIEPGAQLQGQACEPIIVREGRAWVRSSGTGILRCRSMVITDGINRIADYIVKSQGVGRAPAVLLKLVELIAKHSDLDKIFTSGRRIGLFDHFYREERGGPFCGPLLVVAPEKPTARSKDAMLRCYVQRAAAALDRPFALHVSLANHEELLTDYMTELPAGVAEVTIEAPSHITDVILEAFNPDGKLAQRLEGAFIQGFDFGISALGRPDRLPKVFRGAPESADLEIRPRLSTSTFTGPSAGDRSGAFDAIRANRQTVAALVGRQNWSAASLWFERGTEGQLAVIRWMKDRLEAPKIAHAYLVDPFLGSEALQRVIARQGRENINLKILISPGDVDPDAEETDAKAATDSSHANKLVATANEWSDRLCGDISIIDVQRGDGQRQAFHDRFLVLIDQDGVPTAFLLSNSMSKAAGDWPFAICVLDQVTSHRVKAYVEDLIKGIDGDRTVKPIVIWTSEQSQPAASTTETKSAEDRPLWMANAEEFLTKLLHATTRNSADGREIDETVDAFLAAWPSGMDLAAFAEKLVQVIGYREQNVVRISSRLAGGTEEQRDVATRIDGLLLDHFLDGLPRGPNNAQCSWAYINDRERLLKHLGQTINRKSSPTNFVLDRLNPVIEEYMQAMEFQRADYSVTYARLQIATCLISLGLEVAATANAPENFREGMAADYIHWTGRLMRSESTRTRFDHSEAFDEFWRDDVVYCAGQILAVRAGLGSKVEDAITRLLADDMVLPAFKDMVRDGSTTV
jgi:hypothetical protein